MRLSVVLVLVAAVSGCGGISNKLCGAVDQPCCANNVCDTGAVCGADQVCTAGLTCGETCTLGTQRCNATNGIEACTSSGVCPAWTTRIATCPSGSVCTAANNSADCVESCPGACTVDALLCTNEGLRICVASGACPTLMTQPDDSVLPTCITGGQVSAELSWESPTPLGQAVVDLGGELPDSYWLLDDLGNIVRYALGPWEYELRATPGKRMKHLASCGQGSYLYAAGEGGTVFHRSGGTWNEENVGANVTLNDVDCDTTRAFAAGNDGRVYIRDNGHWAGYPTGVTASFTAVASLFGAQQVYLAGSGGLIVKCEATTLPPTCTTESSGTIADLTLLQADAFSGRVWAAGANGALLERNGLPWTSIAPPGLTDGVTALTHWFDSSVSVPLVIAVTSKGELLVRREGTLLDRTQLTETSIRSAWAPDENTLLLGGEGGGLFFRNGLLSAANFTARGGRKPLTADLNAVASLGQGRLFAVGDNGARVRRQNGAWSVDALGAQVTSNLNAVAVRDASEVYAVGDDGTVLVRRYGTWAADATLLTAEPLVAVTLDDQHVWALGNLHLFEKDLATGSWRSVALPAGAPLPSALALRKDASGHAVELVIAGASCSTFSFGLTNDSFTPGPSCNKTFTLNAAAFASNGDLFLGASQSAIFRRTATTMEFENVAGTRVTPFLGLVADGASMWAVSAEGGLFRRLAGTWTEVAADVTTRDFTGVAKDDDGVFVVGNGGLVLRRL